MPQGRAHPTHTHGAGVASPESGPVFLRYDDSTLAVRLDQAPDVARALGQVLTGWSARISARPGAAEPQVSVVGSGGHYATQSVFMTEALDGLGVAGATCAVIADLAQDFFESRPGCMALHCAAFRLGGHLVAIGGPARAGKSTLAARLCAEPDIELFCDDVLPILPDGSGLGLGIALRLRLPLPDAASPALRAHVARHLGPQDDRYGYLCAPNIAPHGTRARLGAVVILDRRPAGQARLHHAAGDEAVHFLLSQNMADLDTPEAALARMTDLLAGARCLRLVYSDLEDAVRVLRDAFGSADPVAQGADIGPALPPLHTTPLPRGDICPDTCWSRSPDIGMQTRDGGAFLWQPGRQMVWHLNQLGLAVWTMLEIPGTARDLTLVLGDYYPDTAIEDLMADVSALLQAFAADGLITA